MKTFIVNGAMYIDDKEVFFDDLEITEHEHEEDVELLDFVPKNQSVTVKEIVFPTIKDAKEIEASELPKYCNCNFCDCDIEDEIDHAEDSIDEILEDYTDILLEIGDTPENILNILTDFLGEVVEMIIE